MWVVGHEAALTTLQVKKPGCINCGTVSFLLIMTGMSWHTLISQGSVERGQKDNEGEPHQAAWAGVGWLAQWKILESALPSPPSLRGSG